MTMDAKTTDCKLCMIDEESISTDLEERRNDIFARSKSQLYPNKVFMLILVYKHVFLWKDVDEVVGRLPSAFGFSFCHARSGWPAESVLPPSMRPLDELELVRS